MIAELGVLNKQYPHADMNPEEERVFLSNCGKDFSVDLEKLRFALEGTFCQYIASHFVILPED
jgi:hypothetical protein